jgi:hypothetical protein
VQLEAKSESVDSELIERRLYFALSCGWTGYERQYIPEDNTVQIYCWSDGEVRSACSIRIKWTNVQFSFDVGHIKPALK